MHLVAVERDHDVRTLATAFFSKHRLQLPAKLAVRIFLFTCMYSGPIHPELNDPIRGLEFIKDINLDVL
jgi:hypothetical protein